jgi:predicted nuclease of predicted toxin-antitoxin system
MRLLADVNFPRQLVDELRGEGHDVTYALTECRSLSDPALLNLAERESRILLTLDADFRQIVKQRRTPLRSSGVVLLRAYSATIPELRPLVLFFRNSGRDWKGRISVIERSAGGQISVQQL